MDLPSTTSPVMDPESMREQVNRILASPGFIRSERMCRFLQFIAERTLSSKTEEIKETVLAVEVFDRDPSYDPRVDTVVRVEARRLRAKLKEYYEGAGRNDPILLELPTGSY